MIRRRSGKAGGVTFQKGEGHGQRRGAVGVSVEAENIAFPFLKFYKGKLGIRGSGQNTSPRAADRAKTERIGLKSVADRARIGPGSGSDRARIGILPCFKVLQTCRVEFLVASDRKRVAC